MRLAEGEPPLCKQILGVEEEEEPPSKRCVSIKEQFFAQVSQKEWNDWNESPQTSG